MLCVCDCVVVSLWTLDVSFARPPLLYRLQLSPAVFLSEMLLCNAHPPPCPPPHSGSTPFPVPLPRSTSELGTIACGCVIASHDRYPSAQPDPSDLDPIPSRPLANSDAGPLFKLRSVMPGQSIPLFSVPRRRARWRAFVFVFATDPAPSRSSRLRALARGRPLLPRRCSCHCGFVLLG
ncbi:hypothetical protein GY45DRAFT_64871 [Cubamyces sp. BRFM 1775]|nr:hypothetical protein GY45DRAFT_64871 [Cubamyces sp. BRFM 1775]